MSTDIVLASAAAAPAATPPATVDHPGNLPGAAVSDGYAVQAPADYDVPTFDSFKAEAQRLGIPGEQFPALMKLAEMYEAEMAPALFDRYVRGQAKQTEGVLRQAWGIEYEAKLAAARRAWDTFVDPADADSIDQVGNNPVVLRLLARVGARITSGGSGGGLSVRHAESDIIPEDDFRELMRDLTGPYWDPQHPRHPYVKARVARHHEALTRKR